MKFERTRLARYDNKSILDEIRRVINDIFGGTIPTIKLLEQHTRVGRHAIRNHFGSWANAIMEAGFDYTGAITLSVKKFSKPKMIEDLYRVKRLNGGKYFTYDYYKSHGGAYFVETLKKYFGYASWPELLREVLTLERHPRRVLRKVNKKRKSQYTEDQLLSELKRVWDRLGRRPTYTEFRNLAQIGTKVYERRFSSWTDAIEIFCKRFQYKIQGKGKSFTNATPDILLSELRAIASKLHTDILTFRKYKENGGTYSIGTFQSQFGSWQKAIEKIGKKNGHSGKYSTEELFDEMQRLWEKLGSQPSYKEMNKFGTISANSYQRRFGSWSKAIDTFCSDRANDDKMREAKESEDIPSPQQEATADYKQNEVIQVDSLESIVVTTPRTPSLRLRFKVMRRDNFKCAYCGRSPATEPGCILHIDHIKPWSKGGETVLENLQTLCERCNIGKSDMTVAESGE